MLDDEYFMRQAIRQALEAYNEDEIPIGAIVVIDNKIVARGHNQVEKLNDATAHAEIIALTTAFGSLGAKYLPEATLYVTVEPCHMCAGALYWSKLKRVVFGATDIKNGYQSFFGSRNPFHQKSIVLGGVLADECAQLMKDFFKNKR